MPIEPVGLDLARSPRGAWAILLDGPEITRLTARYLAEGKVSEPEWEDVVATAARVLGQCPNPRGADAKATGLSLGKVQSGKTTSYTALIALAADNGYRISAVLAGTKQPLLDQTDVRLRHYLETERRSIVAFRNPTPLDATTVSGVLQGNAHALLIALKHRRRIDDLAAVLGSADLRHYPVLLIDDEGDEASLNTQFRAGRESPVYASIRRARDRLPKHAYLAYTATPQANLLIPAIDHLSPDFCALVHPGRDYCGGGIFFGDQRADFLRPIPEEDVAEEEEEAPIPPSLYRALAIFLVGAAIRRLRGESNDLHSMLIHTGGRTASHDVTQAAIRTLIDLWKTELDLPASDPAFSHLSTLLREAYDDLSHTVRRAPPWEEALRQVHDEIRLLEVWMVNSLPLGRDPVSTPFHLRNNIFVGGNMLGRGVTIDGLAVTYITRRAKRETNADTMEQRARWFGYKSSYLDVCRIFLTDRLQRNYTTLLSHEDDFWDALMRNEGQGLPVREWRRIFMLGRDTELNPTRSNVARYRRFRPPGWDAQHHVILDEPVRRRNLDVVRRFFHEHPGTARLFGHLSHRVVDRVPTETVVDELLGKMNFETTWDGTYYCEYLTRLAIDGTLPDLDVILMDDGRTRLRSPDESGRYNPFQGRNRSPGDVEYYPGDQYLLPERPQLQVHIVHPNVPGVEADLETPLVGLFLPTNDPRLDLGYVVRVDVG